jgi:Xaa-Pro aminopeptidase
MSLYSPDRLDAARAACARNGLDALLLSPGSDLRYLTGYPAHASERLTLLVLPVDGPATLIVPRLERPAAEASPAEKLGITLVDHADGTDPYPLVTAAAPGAVTVGLANRMWAEQVLALRGVLPGFQRLAGDVLRALRLRKSAAEVEALRRAGAAIDAVHARMGDWLRPGRTEAAVAADIAAAMRDTGHEHVDFTIVASGPNGASPHHHTSDRVIEPGDPVVVDIGGRMADGYCSDCTRTYVVGGEPPSDFAEYYAVLHQAQLTGLAAVRPGILAAELDAACRNPIAEAGYGPEFLHRTGHGIGLDGHEDPYLVAGNEQPLEPGMAFSIEPGVYRAGRHGARIEDIVVCTGSGADRMNTLPTELVVL